MACLSRALNGLSLGGLAFHTSNLSNVSILLNHLGVRENGANGGDFILLLALDTCNTSFPGSYQSFGLC